MVKAVILVGGEATRLRPLTCKITKAMVPILNRPFLEHLLRYLGRHGITDVILAMCYLPDSIQSYFGEGGDVGVRMTCVVEDCPLGTAGAVKNIEKLLDEPFVVLNGDIITEIDLSAMIRRHQEIKPKATIALTPVDNPTLYGVIETEAGGRVKRFLEKPDWDDVTTNLINAGIYILQPEVLEDIPASNLCMFETYLFPLLLERGDMILGYPSDAYWIDIGTPEKYLRVHHDLLTRYGDRIQTEGKSWIHREATIAKPVLIAEGCTIAEGARIIGPAVLGPRCEVARHAVVEGAVLWEGTKVGEGAVLRNCIVGSHCRIGEGSHIPDGCILGDNVTVGAGNKLPQGVKVWPDERV
ncbi:sugar phosphate nucleotidyltransferase [Chloroflexota bacterium]